MSDSVLQAAEPVADANAFVVAALGLTQVIGYGTLYYSFSILAPSIAAQYAWPTEWVFGALSGALLFGGLAAPWSGRWIDRHGAGRLMAAGSLAAGLSFVAGAFAPTGIAFVLVLIAMEIISTFVQYSAAFALLVQIGPRRAQRNIVYLTLIAGFASTIFWPLTSQLHTTLSWQEVYLVFAAMHLGLCLPIHAWLSRRPHHASAKTAAGSASSPSTTAVEGSIAPQARSRVFALMVTGFALGSFVNAALLFHMVPMLGAVGLGTASVLIGTLFGPAQVLARLVNMIFGGRLSQLALATIMEVLAPLSLVILIAGAPTLAGGIAFAVVFGLSSGLNSIVQGTLPLALFGSAGYGSRLGQMTAARLVASAAAPFGFAVLAERAGIFWTLLTLTVLGIAAVIAFAAIARLVRRTNEVS